MRAILPWLLAAVLCSAAHAQHHLSSITSEHPHHAPRLQWCKGHVISPTQFLTIAHGYPQRDMIVLTRAGTKHRVTRCEFLPIPGMHEHNLKGDLYICDVVPPFRVPPVWLADSTTDIRWVYGAHQLGQWSAHRVMPLVEKAGLIEDWPDWNNPHWLTFSVDPDTPTIPGDSGSGIFSEDGRLLSQWTMGSGFGTGGQGINLASPYVHMLLSIRVDFSKNPVPPAR